MKQRATSKPDGATKIPITFFAPAERMPMEVVHRQAHGLGQLPLAHAFLNAAQEYLFVLNAQRQIVMASENVLELTDGRTMDQIVGLRLGEALGCVYAHECESGCGTSQLCRECNLVRVILRGLGGYREIQECHLTRSLQDREEDLHLHALATPLVYANERYTLLAISSITRRISDGI